MDSSTRWIFWFLAMLPFIYIVYTLFVGLKDAVDKQPVAARSLVSNARYVTIISWSTYPIVYILPMLGPVLGRPVGMSKIRTVNCYTVNCRKLDLFTKSWPAGARTQGKTKTKN